MFQRIAFLLASLLGRLVVALPLNRVASVERGGQRFFRKRRRWYAPILIAASACSLPPPRFLVLSGSRWRAHETTLYQGLYSEQVRFLPTGELEVPARPGVVLAALLASGRHSDDEKRHAFGAALRSLHQLHQLRIGGRLCSHGDATIDNVTYDVATGRAHWFDFETAHGARLPHHSRCADDLRALLFSAAGHLDAPTLAAALVAHYPDRLIISELDLLAGRLARWPDPLHLAQVRLGYRAHQALCAALQR